MEINVQSAEVFLQSKTCGIAYNDSVERDSFDELKRDSQYGSEFSDEELRSWEAGPLTFARCLANHFFSKDGNKDDVYWLNYHSIYDDRFSDLGVLAKVLADIDMTRAKRANESMSPFLTRFADSSKFPFQLVGTVAYNGKTVEDEVEYVVITVLFKPVFRIHEQEKYYSPNTWIPAVDDHIMKCTDGFYDGTMALVAFQFVMEGRLNYLGDKFDFEFSNYRANDWRYNSIPRKDVAKFLKKYIPMVYEPDSQEERTDKSSNEPLMEQPTEKEESMENMEKNGFNFNFEFGMSKDENIASTIMGVAVKTSHGWQIFDRDTETITEIGDLKLGDFPRKET